MKKERLLSKVDANWDLLVNSFAGLDENQLDEKGVVGEWSVRDLLAHVTTWEEEAVKVLALAQSGQPIPGYRPYGGIDNFNAREQERKQSLSLEQLKADLVSTHGILIEHLMHIAESEFLGNKSLLRRLSFDTYRHYQEHANQILGWRHRR
jgi:hypothetical protein